MRIKSIVYPVLLAALSLNSYNSQASQTDDTPMQGIIGGVEAIPGAHPFMGALFYFDAFYCGASLIDTNKVLTAAHCVEPLPERYTIKFGGHDITEASQWQSYDVEKVIVHEGFSSNGSDIAILELVNHVEGIEPIKVISPDMFDSINHGDMLTVMGWGQTRDVNDDRNKLLQVDVPFVSIDVCNDTVHHDGRITESMLCAGFEEGGKDTCHGDSGGPLLLNRNDQLYQVGVVSWGDPCAKPNKPSVYANVSSLLGWIYQHGLETGFDVSYNRQYVPEGEQSKSVIRFSNNTGKPMMVSEVFVLSGQGQELASIDSCTSAPLDTGKECKVEVQLADQPAQGEFVVKAMLDAPDMPNFELQYQYTKVPEASGELTTGLNVSPFITWYSGGEQPWSLEDPDAQQPVLVSGNISDQTDDPDETKDFQTSVLLANISRDRVESISFDYLVSSEQDFDFLRILHNGKKLVEVSGEDNSLSNIEIPMSDGQDILVLEYFKDYIESRGDDAASIQSMNVININHAPTIELLNDIVTVRSEMEYVLDASGSFDQDGDNFTFSWVNTNDPDMDVGTQHSLNLMADKVEEDTQVFYQLTVTDEYGMSASSDIQVTIEKNLPPIASIASATKKVSVGQNVLIDAAESYDPEQDEITFTWQQTKGPAVSLPADIARFSFTAPAVSSDTELMFTVVVTDSFGAKSSEHIVITVEKPTSSGGAMNFIIMLLLSLNYFVRKRTRV